MLGDGTLLNNRYLLTGRIGGGGMGEVWRADDALLGRTVAVKVLTHNPASTQRFLNEARAMATLNHPGVVDVYDYGTDRVSFLVMELVDGESLDRLLERAKLTTEATMRLVVEVAEALAAAHERGIVHRDVKPGNLMIRADGSVVLTDFGIAHSASAGQLTATGQMLCSAGYCAPEQATANRITPAVDLYALGVVAYECLTGSLPYDGETPVQIIFKHLNAPVPELPAEIPPGPRRVIARALAKRPEERWASAEEMAAAARAALDDPGWVPPRPQRRRAVTAIATIGAALLASGAIAASLHLWPPLSAIQLPIMPGGATEPAGEAGNPPATGEQIQPAKQRLTPGPRRPSPSPGTTAEPSGTPTAQPTTPNQPTQQPTTPAEPTPTPTQEPPTEEPTPEPPTQEPTVEPSHQSLPAETPEPSQTPG
ncbi:serine/threonine-protein kinase [Nonomuraea soli]|uniref:non-specific serine/threonine protein kinase n=1 Tax=Nonomuraea soli TaxID=1032476 RepID=A0A7W0CLP7_9ACTN|nr:serine/threonine-protein kinase [Nonomuraea soli]MBA2893430.1 serine/threonine-protein kinase [Nonomuraea soli]